MELLKRFLVEAGGWDYDEFARVWNEAPSIEAVAKHFGITPAYAAVRAHHLRSLDFDLKKFVRGRKAGSKLQRDKATSLPPKSEFIRMWNENPSVNALAAQLGVTPSAVKKLVEKLRSEGLGMAAFAGRGPKRKLDLDETTFSELWEASETLDEVIEKVKEMGFNIPDEKLRPYLTSMAFRVNRARRARGKPDLKKLERPAYHRKLQFADEPESSVPDEDIPFGDEPPGSPEDENPWAEDTEPGPEPEFD